MLETIPFTTPRSFLDPGAAAPVASLASQQARGLSKNVPEPPDPDSPYRPTELALAYPGSRTAHYQHCLGGGIFVSRRHAVETALHRSFRG